MSISSVERRWRESLQVIRVEGCVGRRATTLRLFSHLALGILAHGNDWFQISSGNEDANAATDRPQLTPLTALAMAEHNLRPDSRVLRPEGTLSEAGADEDSRSMQDSKAPIDKNWISNQRDGGMTPILPCRLPPCLQVNRR